MDEGRLNLTRGRPQRHCGILLDDNNRKPICRLHFNTAQKYLGLFDKERNEERFAIEGLDDIFQYAERLKSVVSMYTSE